MQFNIEHDGGDRLSGYLIPDGFRGRCEFVVRVEGQEVWRARTAEERAVLVHVGRHESGLCGYTLDTSALPDLAAWPDLAIHEAASGLLVGRRCPADRVLPHRIVRLETHLLPLRTLDEALLPQFRYGYAGLDRLAGETATQVLMLLDGGSLYASGRVPYRFVQSNMEAQAWCMAVLRDPVIELAERLIVLNRIGATGVRLFGERDALTWAPAVDYVAGLDIRDTRSVRRAIEAMPARVRSLLASPLARLLAAQPDEEARTRHIAPALRTLSRLTLVGLRENWAEFRERLAVLLGLAPEALPMIGEFPAVEALADELRPLRDVIRLLAVDLELYAQVREAFEAGCMGEPDPGQGTADEEGGAAWASA